MSQVASNTVCDDDAILLDIAVPPLDMLLTYRATPSTAALPVGTQLDVPVGKSTRTGYVVCRSRFADRIQLHERELKALPSPKRSNPVFDLDQLELFTWVATYYGVPLSSVIDVAVPRYAPPKREAWIRKEAEPGTPPRGRNQRALLESLANHTDYTPLRQLQRILPGALAAARALAKQGTVHILDKEIREADAPVADWAPREVTLNPAQEEAFQRIRLACNAQEPHPFLLHGVTGSGKTEVYIELARAVRAAGRSVLFLVPEISLTPQLIDRVRARLHEPVAVLHSGLPPRARWQAWNDLLAGGAHVALGARSAIFAPLHNLGLIVVDEEHDPSYKQGEGLRYHARDVALVRAQQARCPIVLGSATPSLETFHHGEQGKYTTIHLSERPEGVAHPEVHIIDMGRLRRKDMASENISLTLRDAVQATVAAKQQVFLLYNRRGFASYLRCDTCHEAVSCSACSVTLTFHQGRNRLLCHYCGAEALPPQYCPACCQRIEKEGSAETPGRLKQFGAGTERIAEEIEALFPSYRVARMDRDSVESLSQYRAMLDAIRSGTVDILVGTQMIAKGHDIPSVTLMGIVNCDVGLHMPDFRAAERTFHLLTQAGGRAGRAQNPGRVILQTFSPRHPSIVFTQQHDYVSFARFALDERKVLNYPPFARLLRIIVSAPDESLTRESVRSMNEAARRLLAEGRTAVSLVGPAPAPIPRLRSSWRWHFLARSPSAKQLATFREMLRASVQFSRRVRVVYDMDPQDMM